MTKKPAAPGIDGFARNPEAEDYIDKLAAAVLGTNAGRELLEYMKSITISRIMGPNATDAELRHMEGQRYLVAVLESRVRVGVTKITEQGTA